MSRTLRPVAMVFLFVACCGGERHVASGTMSAPAPATAETSPAAPAPAPTGEPDAAPEPAPGAQDTDSCQRHPSTLECQCEAGDTPACLELADGLFRHGDHDKAIMEAFSLCQQEAPEACFRTADYLQKLRIQQRLGTNASALRERGVSLYQRACEEQSAPACFHYGKLLLTGKYVTTDVAGGQQQLEASCQAGHAPACLFLANAYQDGARGLEQDRAKALLRLDEACRAGGSEGCTILGDRVAGRDPARAKALYEQGCAGDDGTGCARIGQLYLKAKQYQPAYATLVKACELERPASCVEAGALVEAGNGTATDPAKARTLYETACQAEVAAGCFSLAALVAKGLGGRRNWGEAVALYDKSCAMKLERGCKEATRARRSPPDWHCATEADCEALCAEHLGRACTALGELRATRETIALWQEHASEPEPVTGWPGPSCDGADDAYEMGCEYGDGTSCVRAGKYAEACRAGAVDGCVKADAARYREGDAKQRKQILGTLDKLCRKKQLTACLQLAVLVKYDDTARAHRLLSRSCDLGQPAACRLLSDQLGALLGGGTTPCLDNESLEGCTPAIRDAERKEEKLARKSRALLRKACELGDVRACYSGVFDDAVAEKMEARGRELLQTQSCGRGGLDF